MSNYQLFQNDLPTQVLKSFKGDISIDTETLGLNIKRDRLCLVQLRNESNKKIYLIKFDSKPFIKNSKNLKHKKNNYLIKITKAFQRRFRPAIVNGKIDKECLIISQNLIKQ